MWSVKSYWSFSKISRARDFGAFKHYGSLEKYNQWMVKSRDPFRTGVIVRARWRASPGDASCARFKIKAIKNSFLFISDKLPLKRKIFRGMKREYFFFHLPSREKCHNYGSGALKRSINYLSSVAWWAKYGYLHIFFTFLREKLLLRIKSSIVLEKCKCRPFKMYGMQCKSIWMLLNYANCLSFVEYIQQPFTFEK